MKTDLLTPTSQTGGQPFSDTSPYEISWYSMVLSITVMPSTLRQIRAFIHQGAAKVQWICLRLPS